MIFDLLEQSVFGTVISDDDSRYADARKSLLFNARMPARHPQLIVRAASVGDVQAAVRFAKMHDLHVSVRGGGHNWSGIALQDGLVLDLTALNHIRIDAEKHIAEVGAAVRNGDAARAFAAQGLAFPLGHCASVPLSGYLLGGGIGWNLGAWGIACFSVEAVEVVLADGEVRRASATENPDIFWAVRGAGPEFFGVVTRYWLRLQPLPRAITTSVFTYPMAEIATLREWMSRSVAELPPNLEFTIAFSSAPPHLADLTNKIATAIATVFADTQGQAHAALARIAATAPAGALEIQENMPTPFEVLYAIIAQFFPEAARYAVDSFWGDAEGLFERLATQTAKAPSHRSFSLGVILPPRAASLPDAAFSMIAPAFACAYGIWDDAADDEANVGWLRSTAHRIAPFARGVYVGEADLERPMHIRRCFSAEAWNRLKALQARYDPAGLFRTQQSLAVPLEPAA